MLRAIANLQIDIIPFSRESITPPSRSGSVNGAERNIQATPINYIIFAAV